MFKLGKIPNGLDLLNYFVGLTTFNWSAAASVALGAIQSRGARKSAQSAAAAQQAGAAEATAEQRRQFDISQRQAEPFRQAGLSALNQQLALMGLGGREAIAPVEARAAIPGTQDSLGSLGSLGPIGRALAGRGLTGQVGQAAIEARPGQAAISAEEAQRQAFERFNESPGQAFLRQRGEQAILRGAAATGGLGGARVQEALQQQGIGFAQQDLQNQLARLAALSGQGQAVTQNVSQLGAGTAANIGSLAMQSGQAQASGILGAQQARGQALGMLQSGFAGGAIGAGTPGVGFQQGFASGLSRF